VALISALTPTSRERTEFITRMFRRRRDSRAGIEFILTSSQHDVKSRVMCG
jgi:hypothetical protein